VIIREHLGYLSFGREIAEAAVSVAVLLGFDYC
jgi:hypothetical protein